MEANKTYGAYYKNGRVRAQL